MRKLLYLLVLVSTLALAPAYAQTSTVPSNNGTFSISASAIALPGGNTTVAGTVLGQTVALTDRLSLRADELIAQGSNTTAYYGGLQYFPNFTALLNKTKLNGTLIPYFTASIGEDRVTPPGGTLETHVAILAGGGANYCPISQMCVNAIEVRWAKLPGLTNSTAIISTGLTLTFGK